MVALRAGSPLVPTPANLPTKWVQEPLLKRVTNEALHQRSCELDCLARMQGALCDGFHHLKQLDSHPYSTGGKGGDRDLLMVPLTSYRRGGEAEDVMECSTGIYVKRLLTCFLMSPRMEAEARRYIFFISNLIAWGDKFHRFKEK